MLATAGEAGNVLIWDINELERTEKAQIELNVIGHQMTKRKDNFLSALSFKGKCLPLHSNFNTGNGKTQS